MKNKKIALIGLGYVGLPHAVEFGKNEMLLGLILTSLESMTLSTFCYPEIQICGSDANH